MQMNTKKILTPWNIFLLLVLSAAATVMYVNNVVRVNQLLGEVKALEYSRDSLISSTNILRNELLRLQSSDRITNIAKDKIGLVQPGSAPIIIK